MSVKKQQSLRYIHLFQMAVNQCNQIANSGRISLALNLNIDTSFYCWFERLRNFLAFQQTKVHKFLWSGASFNLLTLWTLHKFSYNCKRVGYGNWKLFRVSRKCSEWQQKAAWITILQSETWSLDLLAGQFFTSKHCVTKYLLHVVSEWVLLWNWV